jgi:hypothetical protein
MITVVAVVVVIVIATIDVIVAPVDIYDGVIL